MIVSGARVRVQGREDEVAGEGGLDAGGRGLVVAHLADHDHVGIGAQERAHGGGEGEVDLRAAPAPGAAPAA